MEIWKKVKRFEGYEISSYGRLYKKDSLITREKYGNYVIPGSFMKPSYDKDGYLKTALRREGKRHFLRVHRIVAEAFLSNEEGFPVVNHLNGVKDDNRVSNLEWCSESMNTRHSFEVLGRVGHNGGMNKPVIQLDPITLEEMATFDSMREAGKAVGVKGLTIGACVNGRLNTAGGFKWKRIGEGVSTIEST